MAPDLTPELDRALREADEETLRAIVVRAESLLDEQSPDDARTTTARTTGDDSPNEAEGDGAEAEDDVNEASGDEERNESADSDSDQPERRDAPPRATRVVKEINDNRYYYWQWREGDRVRSEYIGPVDSG